MLIHDLVFPQINITMNPQVLHRVARVKLFYKTNRYGKYSIAVSAVKSWTKSKNNLKIHYLKIYPQLEWKQLWVIPILNHNNNFNQSCKNIYDFNTSQKHSEQLFQLLSTLARFLFTTLFFAIWQQSNDTSYNVITP